MWIAEIQEGNKAVQKFYLKGPNIVLGRAPDSDVVFLEDKSISRKHVELIVENTLSGPCLFVKDLGSRFGTFLNDVKLVPDQNIPVTSTGGFLKLGAGTTTLSLFRYNISFCMTRLEKQEKERLKYLSKIIGAKIVSSAELATHLITNKMAATAKSLIALVKQIHIVSLSWLSFVEELKPIIPFPNEDRFFPAEDTITDYNLRASRSSLFGNLHVLLTNELHDQYSLILTECGAIVSELWNFMKELDWNQINQEVVRIHNSNPGRKLCIFFDENIGIEPDTIIERKIKIRPIYWITVGILASAVIGVQTPFLLEEPPNKIRKNTQSQSIRPLPVEVINLDNSTEMTRENVPPLPPVQDSATMSVIEQPKQHLNQSIVMESIPAESDFLFAEEENSAPASSSLVKRNRATFDEEEDEDDIFLKASKKAKKNLLFPRETPTQPKNPDSSVSSSAMEVVPPIAESAKEATQPVKEEKKPTKRSRKSQLISDSEEDSPKVPVEKEEIEDSQPSKKRGGKKPPVQKKQELPEDDFFAPAKAKRTRQEVDFQDDLPPSNKPKIEGRGKDPDGLIHEKTDVEQQVVGDDDDDAPVPRKLIDASDWVSAVNHELTKLAIHTNQEEYVVEERNLIPAKNLEFAQATTSSGKVTKRAKLTSTSSAANTGDSSVKNVKKFVKNVVRSVDPQRTLSTRQMDKVLPKETEREVQLRLEFEAQTVQDKVADEMFSEKFGAKKPAAKGKKKNG